VSLHPAPIAAPLHRRTLLAGLAAAGGSAVLAGCSSDAPKPAALEAYTPKLPVRELWRARVSALPHPLQPLLRGDQFICAGDDGRVVAWQTASGAEQWRAEFGAPLSAAVGHDGRFTAAVTRDNELRVLDRGRLAWKAALKSAVATAPLVAGERVFVLGVDREVLAFDALDGRRLWSYQRSGGELLTLSQRAVLMPWRDTLLVGQGANLVGLDPTRGSTRFELPLTPPRGTNEVERLNDLVGPALRLDDSLCVRAFQSAIGCFDVARIRLRWSRLAAGVQALGGDAVLLSGADAAGRVSAWKTETGEIAWTNERLTYRGLGAPLVLPQAVLYGDAQGQLHFLSRDDGQTLQRLATDGSAVAVAPLRAADGTVLVSTARGLLLALSVG
jgi:outer membrane assembly lipoprotein YfgL